MVPNRLIVKMSRVVIPLLGRWLIYHIIIVAKLDCFKRPKVNKKSRYGWPILKNNWSL